MDFITLKNITKTFNGVDVLKNINLKIKEGETLTRVSLRFYGTNLY